MRARGLAQRFPETARIQFPPEGTPARPGWRLVQPELAATLRRIAAEGPRAMYRGELADALVAAVQSRGGILTREDLAAYQSMIRDPVIGYYRGHRIYTFPPPSSGGVALIEALNVLEGFDLAPLGAGSSASIHRIAEAMKFSFADTLAFVGDPDFVSVPVSRLTAKPYAAQLRARLAPTAWWQRAPSRWFEGERPIRVEGPGLPARDAGTTHLSTSDSSGNAVALTMTINTPYGSGITAERTGVLLNNEMDDFAIAPDLPNTYGLIDTRGANAIEARKRPRSSMTPTIVERNGGGLFMVTGSPGGPRIVSTTLLSIVNVIDYGMDASQAVSAPRFHHQWAPDVLYLEPETARDVVDALRERGHEVVVEERDWSAAEAIVRDPDGAFWGGSDPRRDGLAAGFLKSPLSRLARVCLGFEGEKLDPRRRRRLRRRVDERLNASTSIQLIAALLTTYHHRPNQHFDASNAGTARARSRPTRRAKAWRRTEAGTQPAHPAPLARAIHARCCRAT